MDISSSPVHLNDTKPLLIIQVVPLHSRYSVDSEEKKKRHHPPLNDHINVRQHPVHVEHGINGNTNYHGPHHPPPLITLLEVADISPRFKGYTKEIEDQSVQFCARIGNYIYVPRYLLKIKIMFPT